MNLKYDVKISKTHQVHEVLVRLKERGFSRKGICDPEHKEKEKMAAEGAAKILCFWHSLPSC